MTNYPEITPRLFDVEHHARLFGWFAREALTRYGEKGRTVVLEGVSRYGEGRGRRMAQRVRAAGYPLDLVSLLAFSEIDTSCNRTEIVRVVPCLEMRSLECAWDRAWREAGLLQYGCLYCQRVDVSLVRGFNPDFAFEVDGTLSNGAPYCTFRYPGGALDAPNAARLEACGRRIGDSAIRPFSFHVADLYQVMAAIFVEVFGDAGHRSVEAVRRIFEQVYGVPPAPEESV